MAAPTTTKEALRKRAHLLEARIEERNAATEKANRDDEMELGRVYLELAALLAHTHREEPDPPAVKGEAAKPDAGKADPPKAEQPKAKAAPAEVEPLDIGDDLGKQEAVLGFVHKYKGQTFRVAYVAAAMYPDEEKASVAYKKMYATLDAMVRNKKVEKVESEKSRWNPLKPRPVRAIRFPSGLVLLPNGDVQEVGQ
jgi:hypothetical protein